MESSFVSAVVLLLRVCDPLGNVPIVVGSLREVAMAVEFALRGIRSVRASL